MTRLNDAGPLNERPLTKRALLTALSREACGRTCEQLAGATGLSMSGTRATLLALLGDGLVERNPIRKGQGRPAWKYSLTGDGAKLCASADTIVSVELLNLVGRIAPDTLHRAVEQRFKTRAAETLASIGDATAADRIERVSDQMRGYGYMVETLALPGGEFRVSLTHCPIFALARSEPLICAAEQRCLASVLYGLNVRQTANMTDGCPTCSYLVSEQPT